VLPAPAFKSTHQNKMDMTSIIDAIIVGVSVNLITDFLKIILKDQEGNIN